MRRALLLALFVAPVGLFVAGWLLLPGWVEERAARAIEQLGVTLDIDIRYEHLTLEGTDRLVLDGVTVAPKDSLPGELPLAVVERIVVEFTLTSLLDGKARMDLVRLEKPELSVVRRVDGTDNFGELRDRVERLLRRATGDEAVEGATSGLWRHLERSIPRVELIGGVAVVEDASTDRTLIPKVLPSSFRLPGLNVVLRNDSVMTDQVNLEVRAEADVPLVGSRLRAELDYERETGRSRASLQLVTPARLDIGGQLVTIERAAWYQGGALRLSGVSVGDLLDAAEVALWLRDSPPALVDVEPGTLQAALARLRKLAIVEPAIRIGQGGQVPEWMHAALDSGPVQHAPAAEGPTAAPNARRRPRVSKQGARVREGVAARFHSAADWVRRSSALAYRVGRRFPLPELEIKLARFVYDHDGGPPAGATAFDALDRFDLVIRRVTESVVDAELSFPPRPGAAGTDEPTARVSARVQLETGDLQLHLVASELSLHPYRALFADFVRVTPDTALLDTDLRLMYGAAADRLEVHGKVTVRDVGIEAPAVAAQPMDGLTLGAEMQAALDLRAATLRVRDTTLRVGDVPMAVELSIDDLAEAPALRWELDMPRVSAQRIVDALPAAFVGRLDGMRLGGDVAWKFEGELDTRDMESLKYHSDPRNWDFTVRTLGSQIELASVTRKFTQRAPEPDGTTVEFQTGPGARRWVRYSRVSPWMAKVLTTTEDGTFWRHGGIAFFALHDAMVANLQRGRFYRGGSTLTMQLVKNVFLNREKTIARKAQELFLAWRLERFLTKQQIMELYLNIVELGPGIYGIGRAARYYFDKTAAELNLVECAFLASILPNPRKYHYHFRRGKVSENWRKGLERTLQVMVKRDRITPADFRAAAPYAPEFRQLRRR